MKKIFSKVYIVLIIMLLGLLTACQVSNTEPQDMPQNALQVELVEEPRKTSQNSEENQELIEKPIEQVKLEEPTQEVESSDFKFPDDVFIIEVYRHSNGDQEFLTLKDEFLQFWVNENMVCEKKIPVPAEISIGSNFYEIIGNPYISKDGSLVLIQSYTTSKGELKLDYTILAKNCSKIIPSLNYDGYVFQNNEGKYGLVFYHDEPRFPWYPYEGFGFTEADVDFALPKPTTIWLNESTVQSVNFGSWGSTSYGYRDVSAISVRLNVESYGELDIANVYGPFEPVEVDDDFFDLLYEKFAPQNYEKKFSTVLQTINEYKYSN